MKGSLKETKRTSSEAETDSEEFSHNLHNSTLGFHYLLDTVLSTSENENMNYARRLSP